MWWGGGAARAAQVSENALCAPEEYAERDIAMTLMPDAYVLFNDHSGVERTCADDGELFTERAYADVHLTQKIEDAWLARDMSGDYDDITFTFIGTASGAFRMYPGAQLARKYNPTIRPWYFQATAFKVPAPAKPCASASADKCTATNAKCTEVCKDHGFVANEECYGSSPTYVRCMCNDGTDHFDDVCPAAAASKSALRGGGAKQRVVQLFR